MFGKLIKYEWKAVSKLLILIHIALLAFSLVGRFLLPLIQNGSEPEGFIFVIYMMFYVLGIFVIAIMTFLYLSSRFYKNLFTDEGYLMHTLPVTVNQHIWSKCVVFLIWSAIDTLLILLSLAILLLNKESFPALQELVEVLWGTLVNAMNENALASILYMLANFISIIFTPCFLVYFSICLGSLFKNHKLLASAGAFFVIYIFMQIVSTLSLFIFAFNSQVELANDSAAMNFNLGSNLPLPFAVISLLISLVLTLVFYFGSKYIMTKNLNLD